MNLKDTLIKYRNILLKNDVKKTSITDTYMEFIKDCVETTKLTESQF